MKQTATKLRKPIVEAVAMMLVFATVVTPAGRRGAANVGTEFVKISEAIVDLPCRILTGFRSFSLDRLDPTCPQCF